MLEDEEERKKKQEEERKEERRKEAKEWVNYIPRFKHLTRILTILFPP